MNFVDFETRFWKLIKEANIDDHINPINLNEEKNTFISKYNKEIRYNPTFEYKSINFESLLNKISTLNNELNKYHSPYLKYYSELLNNYKIFVENFNIRDNNFIHWLSSKYGKPNNQLFSYSQKYLDNINQSIINQDNYIGFDEAKKYMQSSLVESGFRNWEISKETMSAKIKVNPHNQMISFNSDSVFSLRELQRLVHHEIETHVLRFENGSKQNSNIFKYGFPDYLETEEGLAVLAEEKNNMLDEDVLAKYCVRVTTSYLAYDFDFFDLVKYANQYFDLENSFSIVARIKRGLKDTSAKGGFTKDQIYLKGFKKLQKLDNISISKLYIGKIGYKNIDEIKEFDINYDIKLPLWLEKTITSNYC